jgi:hypothetical protein
MEQIYVKNKDGLRINASTLALVPGQVFYILATAPGVETKIFDSSTGCATFFGTTKQTINARLSSGKTNF